MFQFELGESVWHLETESLSIIQDKIIERSFTEKLGIKKKPIIMYSFEYCGKYFSLPEWQCFKTKDDLFEYLSENA